MAGQPKESILNIYLFCYFGDKLIKVSSKFVCFLAGMQGKSLKRPFKAIF